jgi:hypothetical protein
VCARHVDLWSSVSLPSLPKDYTSKVAKAKLPLVSPPRVRIGHFDAVSERQRFGGSDTCPVTDNCTDFWEWELAARASKCSAPPPLSALAHEDIRDMCFDVRVLRSCK